MAHSSYGTAAIETVVHGVLAGVPEVVTASELLVIMLKKAASARHRGNWAELVESLSVDDVVKAARALVVEEGSGISGCKTCGVWRFSAEV